VRRGVVVKQVGRGNADQRQHQVVAQVPGIEQGKTRKREDDQEKQGGQHHLPRRQAERVRSLGGRDQRQRKGRAPDDAGAENQEIGK